MVFVLSSNDRATCFMSNRYKPAAFEFIYGTISSFNRLNDIRRLSNKYIAPSILKLAFEMD